MGRRPVVTGRIEQQLAALLDCGVTQERAARACGISRRSVTRFAARRRPREPETIKEVLDAIPTLAEVLDEARPQPAPRVRRSRERGWEKLARQLEVEVPERWGLPPDVDLD